MKVLIFMTQFYLLSGAERLDIELAEELNKRGIRTDILSMYSEDLPGVKEAKEDLQKKGIPAIHFLNLTPREPAKDFPRGIIRLWELLQREKYDIIQTSMTGPAVIAAWATLATRTMLVAGLHAMYKRESWRGLKAIFWRFTMRLNHQVRFYAISCSVAESIQRFAGISNRRVRVVYNSINPQFFRAKKPSRAFAEELGLGEEDKIALCVGSLVKNKGIETLLDGLGPILKERSLHLVYVGSLRSPEGFFPGEESSFMQRLRVKIEQNRWARHVHFVGQRNDVDILMTGSDLLVHPTWSEGFGLVLIEAMATGLPVVSTDIDAIPEVVKGTRAVLVPAKDPEGLRRGVERVLNFNDEELHAVIHAGQSRAREFQLMERVDRLIVLFQDVLLGGGESGKENAVVRKLLC